MRKLLILTILSLSSITAFTQAKQEVFAEIGYAPDARSSTQGNLDKTLYTHI